MRNITKKVKGASHNKGSLNEKDREQIYENIEGILNKVLPIVLTQKEKELIRNIYQETQHLNENNVTRTSAYLSFFNKHPEVHWSFLAHMVSRNGGYNMTDLKGTLLNPFLTEKDQLTLFQFLEKANALIFHDAYPQLLLYKASKKEQMSLFHLLPTFNVSRFMIPIWEYFFKCNESTLLTHALITNEQQYIEKHLMTLPFIKNNVLKSFSYILQEKLGFTHVIFPYKRYPFLPKYSLAGIEVHNFTSVKQRIDLGKNLYNILYTNNRFDAFHEFSRNHPHTGSRTDYWAHIFSENKLDSRRLNSPSLKKTWANVTHEFNIKQDWFKQVSQIENFDLVSEYRFQDITKEVTKDINILKTLGKIKEISPLHTEKG
ncbi:DUF2515 family protein [Metabacillus litoralis]|uniref:DUF2515 family protein n=1 Tax=Metabacillus litoralis TaxID=152268 RepID=UPI001CFD58E5|nr:DUF2515 family protein [Metabacillus litoralis]